MVETIDQMVNAAQSQDFDNLIKIATAFMQKYRQEAAGPALMSVALAGKKQYNEALASVDKAVQLGLPPSDATDFRIDIYMQSGDTAKLLKEFSSLTQNSQRSYEAYLGRANVLLDLGDYDQALADASQAIALSPDPMSYCIRGHIYRAQGQLEKAVEDYSRAIRLEPDEMRLLYQSAF